MKLTHTCIILLVIISFSLTACSKDSSLDNANSTEQDTLETAGNTIKTTIILNYDGLEIDESFSVVTENEITSASSKNITLDLEKNALVPVILADVDGEPILVGRKFPQETFVEISIESTAEYFVLRTSKFFGITITNERELSRRIREHEKFPQLINLLNEKIQAKSPCPLDQECSFRAYNVALEISGEINITDLVG